MFVTVELLYGTRAGEEGKARRMIRESTKRKKKGGPSE
jgi:hypothetical protein